MLIFNCAICTLEWAASLGCSKGSNGILQYYRGFTATSALICSFGIHFPVTHFHTRENRTMLTKAYDLGRVQGRFGVHNKQAPCAAHSFSHRVNLDSRDWPKRGKVQAT